MTRLDCCCCFLAGIGYDLAMMEHSCICGKQDLHPEQPDRIASIYRRLRDTGLLARTTGVRARQCTLDELRLVHTEAHLRAWAGVVDERQRQRRSENESGSTQTASGGDSERSVVRLACGGLGADADTFFNAKHTPAAARTAVGIVVDLALKIASGELRNAFAIVRPPGAPLSTQHNSNELSVFSYLNKRCCFLRIALASSTYFFHFYGLLNFNPLLSFSSVYFDSLDMVLFGTRRHLERQADRALVTRVSTSQCLPLSKFISKSAIIHTNFLIL